MVETIAEVGDIWDFDTLALEILPITRDEIRINRRRRNDASGRKFAPPAGFSAASLWASRLDDFQKLITHRYGALTLPSGERDHLMLLYGIGMSYLVDNPERLRQEMFSIANDVCGWPEHEVRSRLSSVFSRADAAFRGERLKYLGAQLDPRYRYKDSTLIELLGVREQEMRVLGLRHLVTEEIKRERDRRRKIAERRVGGAVSREIYLADSLSHMKPWQQEGFSRRTWERRRAQNARRTEAAVASPSGCMVAEPRFLRSPEGPEPPTNSAADRHRGCFRTSALSDTGCPVPSRRAAAEGRGIGGHRPVQGGKRPE